AGKRNTAGASGNPCWRVCPAIVSRLIKALKLTGRRRFALRAVASCRYGARDSANARHVACRPISVRKELPTNVRFGSEADIFAEFDRCPLYPQKRTFVTATGMSAMCQQL